MKNLIFAIVAVAVSAVSAQDAAMRKDENPYSNYNSGTARQKGMPMAVEWHFTDRKAIDDATAPEALEAILSDEAKVKELISKVKPDFKTDAMDAVRIAAISQYVMRGLKQSPKSCGKAGDCSKTSCQSKCCSKNRKLWAGELLAAACAADDDYVKEYYLDQLRWCGMACQAEKIKKLADGSDSKALKDMAAIVIDQITGAAIK